MTVIATRVNGVDAGDGHAAIAVTDRGLNYGDGLFETTLLRNGSVRFLEAHLQRLRQGCERLGMTLPEQSLRTDIQQLCGTTDHAVLKIVITRGAGGRGYRPEANATANRIVTLHALPPDAAQAGLVVRWCELRLCRNAPLAGLKHLNRLEQVLAQNEWHDEHIHEGLLLDTEGELVSATAGNVFAVRQGVLVTADLRFCGVRGVMRAQVLRVAAEQGITFSEEPLWPHDIEEATEVFVTNAVRGIRPVIRLGDLQWQPGPVAARLAAALEL